VATRVVIAHDWLCGLRGGELVLDAICRAVAAEPSLMCGDADGLLGDGGSASVEFERVKVVGVLAMFADGKPLTKAIDALPRVVSVVGKLPWAARVRRWLLPIYPLAVWDLSRQLAKMHAREPIDLVVTTSSCAIKALRAPKGVPHVCYVHAPARYIWSRGGDYARGGVLGRVRGVGLLIVRNWFKRWDFKTAQKNESYSHGPDVLLANSTHTQSQIRACWGREAQVLYPPVRTGRFVNVKQMARERYWLYVGALEPYKRVDVAIVAAARAGVPLVIIGKGSQEARLRALAKELHASEEPVRGADEERLASLVRFLGHISEENVVDAMCRARLLVLPQVEDFGIVAVEALACGTPVVARAMGGAMDIVREGVNGAVYCVPEDVSGDSLDIHAQSMMDAAARCPLPDDPCDSNELDLQPIRASAMRFGEAEFAREFVRVVKRVLEARTAP